MYVSAKISRHAVHGGATLLTEHTTESQISPSISLLVSLTLSMSRLLHLLLRAFAFDNMLK